MATDEKTSPTELEALAAEARIRALIEDLDGLAGHIEQAVSTKTLERLTDYSLPRALALLETWHSWERLRVPEHGNMVAGLLNQERKRVAADYFRTLPKEVQESALATVAPAAAIEETFAGLDQKLRMSASEGRAKVTVKHVAASSKSSGLERVRAEVWQRAIADWSLFEEVKPGRPPDGVRRHARIVWELLTEAGIVKGEAAQFAKDWKKEKR